MTCVPPWEPSTAPCQVCVLSRTAPGARRGPAARPEELEGFGLLTPSIWDPALAFQEQRWHRQGRMLELVVQQG